MISGTLILRYIKFLFAKEKSFSLSQEQASFLYKTGVALLKKNKKTNKKTNEKNNEDIFTPLNLENIILYGDIPSSLRSNNSYLPSYKENTIKSSKEKLLLLSSELYDLKNNTSYIEDTNHSDNFEVESDIFSILDNSILSDDSLKFYIGLDDSNGEGIKNYFTSSKREINDSKNIFDHCDDKESATDFFISQNKKNIYSRGSVRLGAKWAKNVIKKVTKKYYN